MSSEIAITPIDLRAGSREGLRVGLAVVGAVDRGNGVEIESGPTYEEKSLSATKLEGEQKAASRASDWGNNRRRLRPRRPLAELPFCLGVSMKSDLDSELQNSAWLLNLRPSVQKHGVSPGAARKAASLHNGERS